MPFNLVPPWNAGYALPKNVNVEGLQRGTFTTMQAPRGTYDDPTVGTGGYAVPRYVMDEGYGQGTFTTAWMPRGEYGPAVPNWIQEPTTKIDSKHRVKGGTEFSFDVLSGALGMSGDDDVGSGAEAGAYAHGLEVARSLIALLNNVPVQYRQEALKKVLDNVDPGLWPRVATRGAAMEKRGVRSRIALERALGIEMTRGLVQELVQIGKTGAPPKPTSMLGITMYGEAGAMAGLEEELGGITDFLGRQARRVKHVAQDAGSWTKKYAAVAYRVIKKITCKSHQNKFFQIGATAVATYYGGPAGAVAAQGGMAVVRNQTCPEDPAAAAAAAQAYVESATGRMAAFTRRNWLPLIVLGGGAAALYVASRKKKGTSHG